MAREKNVPDRDQGKQRKPADGKGQSTEKKPFDKKKYRLQKYSTKYKSMSRNSAANVTRV